MSSYCTLFDSHYLTRGLALYESLARTGDPFQLFILCFDDASYHLLARLALPQAVLISLREFESPALLNVKLTRTPAEYCWTCTPHLIRYVLDRYALDQVTYLDADLFFFASPELLLAEFTGSGGSVLITEHRYTPQYDQSATSGIYCVQFMTFKADPQGRRILQWWQDRCLEWCFARFEDGKFGDQKYLDDWPTRFTGVHVLAHRGGGLAPWNIQQYRVAPGPGGLQGTERGTGRVFPVIFYHFHGLALYRSGVLDLSAYRLGRDTVRWIYRPYIRQLSVARTQAAALARSSQFDGTREAHAGRRALLAEFKRRLKQTYNVYDQRTFLEG